MTDDMGSVDCGEVAKFVRDRYCMRCCAGDDVVRCLKCIYNANNLFFSLPGECFRNLFIPDEEDDDEENEENEESKWNRGVNE